MSALPARLRAVDPLVGVVALVSLIVYLLHGFNGLLNRDLGVYTYGGQRFVAGDPPYVGILNRAGPLAHALPGVGIWLGRLVGVGDVHAARGFFMLLSISCVCLVYVVVRDLTRSRAAAVIASVGFLGFQGFIELSTNGPREKTAMVLFLLVAVLALIHRRWATCGVFVALGTLTWQPVFFVIAVTAVVAALLAPERRLRAVLGIAVGGAATTAVVLGYYVVNGDLHTFLEGFVLINAKYTEQPSAVSQLSLTWHTLMTGYGSSLWVILLGLVALPVRAVASARSAWRTHESTSVAYVALGLGWLTGLAWSAIAFNGWPDLFVMLPLAGIGLGAAAEALLRHLDVRTAIGVTALLAVVGTTYATVFSASNRDHRLLEQRASIAAVLRAGPHPATILSVQAPEVLAISRRTSPTPYQMFTGGFSRYIDDTYPGGLAGYLAWMQKQAPTYIVTQHGRQPSWLRPWLEQHYKKVGSAPRFDWWVSRSVPPDEQLKIQRANRAALGRATS